MKYNQLVLKLKIKDFFFWMLKLIKNEFIGKITIGPVCVYCLYLINVYKT